MQQDNSPGSSSTLKNPTVLLPTNQAAPGSTLGHLKPPSYTQVQQPAPAAHDHTHPHPHTHTYTHAYGPKRGHHHAPSIDSEFVPGAPLPNAMSPLALPPRPFPPPTLADVPVEYIYDQLRNLAPYYWNKPETADCTIIIPVPNNRPRPLQALSTPESTAEHAGRRRAMEYAFNGHPAHPPIVLKLHVDYLTARSTFLRGLFTGKSPHELLQDFRRTSSTGSAPSSPPNIPPSRLPRVLPNSPPGHPIVVLPVPDPASIHLIFYWMYHGKTRSLEDCLAQGVVEWEGVARNVEYLGLPSEIKIFLGRWYGNWLLPNQARDEIVANPFGEDDDDEDEDDDNDDDGLLADESDIEMSCGEDDGMPPSREVVGRGRDRAVRPLTRGHPPRP